MKKLLVTGCSFVAGDALTWDRHHPDIDWIEHIAKCRLHPKYTSKTILSYMNEYIQNIRPFDNLSGRLGKLLNTEVCDLSIDGNTNDNITTSTIGFLENLSESERKQYHVCVGWTELTRRTKWSSNENAFINLHHNHLNDKGKTDNYDYIREVIVNSDDMDHFYNFLNNVLLLQTYLKYNGMTYAFWRSLGHPYNLNVINSVKNVFSLTQKHKFFTQIKMLNSSDWIKFDDSLYPWISEPWSTVLTEQNEFISEVNRHPNLNAVEKLSSLIFKEINQFFQ